MIILRKYDNGKWAVAVERFGYHHTYESVTAASIQRLSQLCAGKQRIITRKYDHNTTTVKL